ncbi:hypothetical protein BN7_5565 [Wickerhamomyces ciferrii]|uniref:Survival protein SurE-like phosphatase/nucleotidase domain-containing protein n=1 Tax=Wickerhamomyces ciferrii (strain ATCC 14091 / BCRC 22168 / CBS 111 / JCM 3599 / NBRC 0793 / NRRL Y-1031 F-60-10) TaxID=1206466 RepID=K0KY09_WICCF|nr:uncharacterized protein BN7_5565 [Wickerhamomyces ciferrii]CCH45978.1 hypothetical protein BN7_5565 [Wickerhamomyces ciferrii]
MSDKRLHVLLTNDDGPLNDETSPYIKFLVDAISKYTNWNLSIVVPNTQRSWIGKAHFAGKDLTASFIYTENDNISNSFKGPFPTPQSELNNQGLKEWALIDGTPASCTDIGVHHIYNQEKGPVDLVISGPNFGRNSTALYITSSGTVGAAMEGALTGIKSIGLSYAFETRDLNVEITTEAAKISVELIKYLYDNWNNQVDLYTINIPLIQSLKFGETKIEFASILPNKWGSIFKPLEQEQESEGDKDIIDESSNQKIQFKWSPNFNTVHETVLESQKKNEHNDGIVLLNGGIRYVLNSLNPDIKTFHYGEYEELDIDRLQSNPEKYFINSYIYRKAIIRKHYLAHTIHSYKVKNPNSILHKAFPDTFNLEVDYAEFLDDSLDESFELRNEIESGLKTWILKPSMSDRGQGIRIFQTIDQLQKIFDSFEQEDSDDEEDEDQDNNGVITSQLRHFVVQEYKSNPLLLSHYQNKKFHIRTYVLANGSIDVFVFKKMLTLFALTSYTSPEINENDEISLYGHLTNTCLQGEEASIENNSVVEFWSLEGLTTKEKQYIFNQLVEIVGEVFKAAINVDKMNFQPLGNAFEIFGLDFIIDDELNVSLLECNSYPDFKQTGDDLKSLIFELFDSVVERSVVPFFKGGKPNDNEFLVKAYSENLNSW